MANFLPASKRCGDPRGQLLDVEGPLRHHDRVRTGSHARVQRDPAGVPPHHLDDHHPLVRLGGGLEPVQRLGGDTHRGVEAERHVRDRDVVVDGLRHADDRQPGVRQQPRRLQRALAADRDDRVQAQLGDMAAGPLHAVPQMRGLHPGRPEDGAAARQDAADGVEVELAVIALQQALPAVAEADHLIAVIGGGAVDDGPDDGVQTGAVSAGGEYTNTHCSKTLCSSTGGPDPVVRLDPAHPTSAGPPGTRTPAVRTAGVRKGWNSAVVTYRRTARTGRKRYQAGWVAAAIRSCRSASYQRSSTGGSALTSSASLISRSAICGLRAITGPCMYVPKTVSFHAPS